jgi:large subunit ribosomal protein L32e
MAIKGKKAHPTFNVPNFGARSRKRVKARWRKQRGIDNKKRIKKDFMGAEPTIGYRNPEGLRGVRASGKRIMLIHNADELKRLMGSANAGDFEVTIASAVSKRKKAEITALAGGKIRITNGAYA